MDTNGGSSISAYLRGFCHYLKAKNQWPRTRHELTAAYNAFRQSRTTNHPFVNRPFLVILHYLTKHHLVKITGDTVSWGKGSGAPKAAKKPPLSPSGPTVKFSRYLTENWQAHRTGARILPPSKVTSQSDRYCFFCAVICSSAAQLVDHCKGRNHQRTILKATGADGKFRCPSCEITLDSLRLFEEHCASDPVHRAKLVASNLRNQRASVESDKGGITISFPFTSRATGATAASSFAAGLDPLGVAGSTIKMEAGSVFEETITCTNRGSVARRLFSCKQAAMIPDIQFGLLGAEKFGFSEVVPPGGTLLAPNESLRLNLRIKPSAVGALKSVLVFQFEGFVIGRYIDVLVEDQEMKSIAPTAPHVPKPRPKRDHGPPPQVVEGVKPKGVANMSVRLIRFPPCDVPPSVRRKYADMNPGEIDLPGFEGPLTMENYAERFQLLMFIEELQMEVDIRTYDMHGVTMLEGKYCSILAVPGLAEKRPSVLFGDRVYVSRTSAGVQGSQTRVEYQGYVHQVEQEQVQLCFDPSFHKKFIKGEKYNVRFEVPRGPIKAWHLAMTLAEDFLSASVLMPERIPPALMLTEPPPVSPLDRLLNEEQREVAAQVLMRTKMMMGGGAGSSNKTSSSSISISAVSFLPPYIVFGPPGTGKTKTVVETILQVVRHHSSARLLVCAPSNSAADNMAERLKGKMQVREMLRVVGVSRSKDQVDPSLLPYCCYDDRCGAFSLPSASAVAQAKVVIVTCCSANLLHRMGLPRSLFSHIFIDEAGHSIEPEGLIPIACFAGPHTVILLAGDHQQLGPIVRSLAARKHQLDCSLLERLAGCSMYSPTAPDGSFVGYNTRTITKLVKNYRSHPKILELPSEMFYEGELEPCADLMARSSLCKWPELPNLREFPILFHGVVGKDEREGNSSSFFNTTEASTVIKHITSLQSYRSQRVPLTDIGVVTPYRKQVMKMRRLLEGKGMAAVKVGSVEEFQGQERRVIIISTVRSSHQFVEFDYKHNLGFLSNPKRFNVAVTRAKQLLVVVGNPHLLAQDACWGALLRFCIDNNAYKGCPPPPMSPAPDAAAFPFAGDGRDHQSREGDATGADSLVHALSQLSVADDREVEREWPGNEDLEWPVEP